MRQKIHDLPGYAEKILAALIEGTVADQQCRELYALAAAHQDELTVLLERDNDNQKQLADQHEELVALRTKRARDRQRAEVTQDLLTEKIRDLRAELDQTAPRNSEAPRPTVERRQTSTPHPRGSQTIPDEESDDFGSDQEPAKTKFAIRKVFPDPELLSDGKKVDFETWEFKIREKLRRDTGLFPTRKDKLGYLISRTEGRASKSLLMRLKPGPAQIHTVDEAIKALEALFIDRHQRSRARLALSKLRFKEGGDYQAFQAEFLDLLIRAAVPVEEYKIKLARRLPESIAPLVAQWEEDEDIDFEEYQSHVSTQIHNAEKRAHFRREREPHQDRSAASAFKKKDTARASSSSNWRAKIDTPAPATTPAAPITRQSTRPTAPPARTNNSACFSCGGRGHVMKDCPTRKSVAEIDAQPDSGDEDGAPFESATSELSENEQS